MPPKVEIVFRGCIALKMFEHSDQFPSSPRRPGFSPEACPGISGRGPGPKATDLCEVFKNKTLIPHGNWAGGEWWMPETCACVI